MDWLYRSISRIPSDWAINGLECADEIAQKHDVMPHDPGPDALFLRQHFLALIGQGRFPFTVIISSTIHHHEGTI